MLARFCLFLAPLVAGVLCHDEHPLERRDHQFPIQDPKLSINGIPYSTRAYWMRQANLALHEPCPFAAFGSVIVNHTGDNGLGQLVCTGANSNRQTGNPTLHAIAGRRPRGLPSLTLYTNAESCPMCASAIRWAGFREYVYGTSIDTLVARGWGQIRVASADIFRQSWDLPYSSRLIGGVLANETDTYFGWQFDPAAPCPTGCGRALGAAGCVAK
ncbi:guanine deaminase [Apiospora marii]|uniref:Guanine deaminase n=1 Tax=Apiospora marii TaxID=335849 RepID=A0ABR1R9Q4_9PEZI